VDRLNEILPYIDKEECAFFIGAGLSKIAGCYDWDSVVQEMLNDPLIKEKEIKKDELPNDYPTIINFCKNIYQENNAEDKFWGIVRRAVSNEHKLYSKKYAPLIESLKKISPKIKIIFTTNIDNCLEMTREYDLSKVFYELNEFTENKFDKGGIFHIHGYIEKFKESLLTREDYIPRYRDAQFINFLKSFFSKYSVLFLGCSLRDKEITDFLLDTKNNNKKRFLLVPEEDEVSDSVTTVNADMYKLTTIVYGKRSDFSNIFTGWINRNFATIPLAKGMESPSA